MQVESIHIKNYRVFRDVVLDNLQPMTVVVGTNGSGKSTLFDVFSFLKESLSENVSAAVVRRGGFQELVSRNSEGAIGITIKFRESGGPLITYQMEVGVEEHRAIVEREILMYRRGSHGRPWRFIDFSRGRGIAITNESAYAQGSTDEERKEYALGDSSILAIKGLGQFQDFPVVSEFRSLIENWHVSNFQISDARLVADAGYAEHLSSRGENIALVAKYLYDNHHEQFERVLDAMRRRVPGVIDVEAKATDDGRLVLRFKDGAFKDPFIARYVSDGTIKMFAYLVLLYDPRPHALLAIEEPENQLYPHLLWELAEEFRAYADRGGQVFISTHSPEFLNGVGLEELVCLVKNDGFSRVVRPRDSATLRDLVNGGDPPGRLWKQGLLEGVLQ